MSEWASGWPDWRDIHRRVLVVWGDGESFEGVLGLEDHLFTGEEEIPLFDVTASDGRRRSFGDCTHWRFVNTP